jgi:hypothetical protein
MPGINTGSERCKSLRHIHFVGVRTMAQLSARQRWSSLSLGSITMDTEPRPCRVMARVYRDIGLAVVAGALEIPAGDLDVELSEAIRRGARYLVPMLANRRSPTTRLSRS